MSFLACCDHCGAVRPSDWDSGPKDPNGWHSFALDNVLVHGCSREHLDLAVAKLGDTSEKGFKVLNARPS